MIDYEEAASRLEGERDKGLSNRHGSILETSDY